MPAPAPTTLLLLLAAWAAVGPASAHGGWLLPAPWQLKGEEGPLAAPMPEALPQAPGLLLPSPLPEPIGSTAAGPLRVAAFQGPTDGASAACPCVDEPPPAGGDCVQHRDAGNW